MTCRFGTNVIACGPPPGVYKRSIKHCPVCERRHRFVVRWDGVWYGTTLYGLCGDTWQDGALYPRPFERGWREKKQQQARRMWDSACSAEAYERYIDADSAMYGPDIRTFRQERKALRRLAIARELIRREEPA